MKLKREHTHQFTLASSRTNIHTLNSLSKYIQVCFVLFCFVRLYCGFLVALTTDALHVHIDPSVCLSQKKKKKEMAFSRLPWK